MDKQLFCNINHTYTEIYSPAFIALAAAAVTSHKALHFMLEGLVVRMATETSLENTPLTQLPAGHAITAESATHHPAQRSMKGTEFSRNDEYGR